MTAKRKKAKPRKRKPYVRKSPRVYAGPSTGRTQMVSLRFPHALLSQLDDVAHRLDTDRTGILKAVASLYLDERHDETIKRLLARRDDAAAQVDLFK